MSVYYVYIICILRVRFSTLLDDLINKKNPQPHMVEGFVICNILTLRELWGLDISAHQAPFVYYMYIMCTYPQDLGRTCECLYFINYDISKLITL